MENKAVKTFSDIVEDIMVRLSLVEELLLTEDVIKKCDNFLE